MYAHFNAGKESVALDLKSPAGLEIARGLIAKADVLVENYRPGVMARLGLDYPKVRELNPQIVFCSISGYGQAGPLAGQGAYAPVVHAMSGYDLAQASAHGPDAPPAASGVMIADPVAGAYAFGAIQTALLRRARFGGGEHIDVTLLESMMTLVAIQYAEAQADPPARSTVYTPLAAADGHVMIPLVSVRNYLGMYPLLGRSDWLADPEFNTLRGVMKNRAAILAALNAWTAARSVDDCETALAAAGVPCAGYRTAAQMLAHPHLTARGSFAPITDAAGPFSILSAPFKFADGVCAAGTFVDRQGEHTRAVVQEILGFDDVAYERLAAEKAFG
jgi:crotonobetainyl-CoA:carnitine CoA-transferase CaiB-like acyl-CoA transferase